MIVQSKDRTIEFGLNVGLEDRESALCLNGVISLDKDILETNLANLLEIVDHEKFGEITDIESDNWEVCVRFGDDYKVIAENWAQKDIHEWICDMVDEQKKRNFNKLLESHKSEIDNFCKECAVKFLDGDEVDCNDMILCREEYNCYDAEDRFVSRIEFDMPNNYRKPDCLIVNQSDDHSFEFSWTYVDDGWSESGLDVYGSGHIHGIKFNEDIGDCFEPMNDYCIVRIMKHILELCENKEKYKEQNSKAEDMIIFFSTVWKEFTNKQLKDNISKGKLSLDEDEFNSDNSIYSLDVTKDKCKIYSYAEREYVFNKELDLSNLDILLINLKLSRLIRDSYFEEKLTL